MLCSAHGTQAFHCVICAMDYLILNSRDHMSSTIGNHIICINWDCVVWHIMNCTNKISCKYKAVHVYLQGQCGTYGLVVNKVHH